jgi:chromosome segregation ATPase
MKKLFVLVSLLALVGTALGFGLPGVGGGSANTAKLDALIAQIDGINSEFTTIYAKVKAANDAITAVETAHNITGVLADAAKLQELAQALTPAEKSTLQSKMTDLATVVTALTALQAKIPPALAEVPTVLQDLTAQATSNPTILTQVKSLQDKLTQAQNKLNTTGTNATNAVTESAKLGDALKALTVG